MRPTDDPCPECGRGELEIVLCSRSFDVEGRILSVPGLMPFQCRSCGARIWPDAETERARKALEILKRSRAA